VLNAIYEEDFLGLSYGFRPGRSPHRALDALAVGIEMRKVSWVTGDNYFFPSATIRFPVLHGGSCHPELDKERLVSAGPGGPTPRSLRRSSAAWGTPEGSGGTESPREVGSQGEELGNLWKTPTGLEYRFQEVSEVERGRHLVSEGEFGGRFSRAHAISTPLGR